ncbi:MAG: 1-acyl-sn-glycerol-3-phosphate acyltransferase [Thermoanaerobaculia bacterium]
MEDDLLKKSVPELGDLVPKRGNAVTRAAGAAVLRLLGWRFEGPFPNVAKLVAIGAPHTTAKDFLIAIATILALGIRATWLGIDWIFRFPLMRWVGGVPIDRSRRQDVVSLNIDKFKDLERYVLALAPEGSRKKVVPWKTGFYHIAHGAGVPILMIGIDQQHKILRFGPCFETSGDLEADMEKIRSYYAPYVDRYSERFGI